MNAGSSGGGSSGGGVTDYLSGFQDQLNNLVQGALDTFDNNNNDNNVVKENPYATNIIGHLPSEKQFTADLNHSIISIRQHKTIMITCK